MPATIAVLGGALSSKIVTQLRFLNLLTASLVGWWDGGMHNRDGPGVVPPPVLECRPAKEPTRQAPRTVDRDGNRNREKHLYSCFKETFMKRLFRRTFAAVLAVSALSLCAVPSRGDSYASTWIRATGSETVNITDQALGFTGGGYYADYQTTVGSSSDGGHTVTGQVTYNTFCVDLTHEATGTFSLLANPSLPSTSSYTGGGTTGATTPNGTTDAAFGYAAWIANTYSSSATTLDQQAGLQIAIWKVLYESNAKTPNWDVTAGQISFSGSSGEIKAAQTYVNDWLAAFNAGGGTSRGILVNYANYAGSSDHPQYQLIAAAPEPSTLAIACLAVIGFVGYGLKRRRLRA